MPTFADGLVIQTYAPLPCSNGSRSAQGSSSSITADEARVYLTGSLRVYGLAPVAGG